MANKRAQGLRIPDFNPRGALAANLPDVPRIDGGEDAVTSAVAGRVAKLLGNVADEQAVIEGTRAGQVEGAQEGFRPTQAGTLRGQAYDKAGTATYLDTLDAKLRGDMQSVFEANERDPVALRDALDKTRLEYERQHIFPEIQGQFAARFERLRLPFQNKALDNFNTARKDSERAALLQNLNEVDTAGVRTRATLDPDDPNAAAVIADGISQRDRLIDRAIEAGVMTQTAGAAEKLKARREALVESELARARKITNPDELAAWRAGTRQRFADGKIGGLDGEGFQALDAQLEREEARLRTGARTVGGALTRQIDDYVQRAAAGDTPSPQEWTQIVTAAKDVPDGDAMVEQATRKLTLATYLRNKTPAEGAALVDRMRAEQRMSGGVSPAEADLARFAEKIVEEQQKGLASDLLGTAARKGIIDQVTPLDVPGFQQTPGPEATAALAGQFRGRAAQARATAEGLQRAPMYLRPAEKEQMAAIVRAGGDKALALAEAIVGGAGGDAPAILRELGGDAPLLAQAGAILANGGSRAAARDAMEALRLRAAGGQALPSPNAATMSKARRDVLGTAYLDQPEDGQRVNETARAIAQARMVRENVQPGDPAAAGIVERAYQEAAGARFEGGVQYGGIGSIKTGWFGGGYRVAVPPGVRADRFRDVLQAVRDEDLTRMAVPPVAADGRPYRARDLAGARPVAVPGGYRFAMGDPASNDPRFVRGADGRPFVLRWDDMAGELRRRVPRAFLGGE